MDPSRGTDWGADSGVAGVIGVFGGGGGRISAAEKSSTGGLHPRPTTHTTTHTATPTVGHTHGQVGTKHRYTLYRKKR